MQTCGLTSELIHAIKKILTGHPNIKKAMVFGSRAKQTHQPYSDIDIALFGDVSTTTAEYIACELDEMPTAFTFDVVAYDAIKNDALRAHIDRIGVLIYELNAKPSVAV